MKRMVSPFWLGVVAVYAMIGCSGGGGGGGPSVTPPSQSPIGTYTMTGFDVRFSDGTSFNQTDPLFTSWSGTMKVGENTISQTIILNNGIIAVSGTYTATWTIPNTAGILHVTDQTGTYDIAFTISGYDVTTYSGVMEIFPGLTGEEYDYWTKVSDSLSPARESSVMENSDDPAYTGTRWIGELLVH